VRFNVRGIDQVSTGGDNKRDHSTAATADQITDRHE
jgi:hypothetical protein